LGGGILFGGSAAGAPCGGRLCGGISLVSSVTFHPVPPGKVLISVVSDIYYTKILIEWSNYAKEMIFFRGEQLSALFSKV